MIKGCETKDISSVDRNFFGIGRIDVHLDNNFTWGNNSLLTRLSSEMNKSLKSVFTDIIRNVRHNYLELEKHKDLADSVRIEAQKFGVKINTLQSKIDIKKFSLDAGVLALHHENIPLRNFGSGSKKLISCAMQMKLHDGRNITLIDEIELGLEPHRIRGLIKNLKQSGQQVITTTHSPVVLRELKVMNDELYICRQDNTGEVRLISLRKCPGLKDQSEVMQKLFLAGK